MALAARLPDRVRSRPRPSTSVRVTPLRAAAWPRGSAP